MHTGEQIDCIFGHCWWINFDGVCVRVFSLSTLCAVQVSPKWAGNFNMLMPSILYATSIGFGRIIAKSQPLFNYQVKTTEPFSLGRVFSPTWHWPRLCRAATGRAGHWIRRHSTAPQRTQGTCHCLCALQQPMQLQSHIIWHTIEAL